jgi:hypothetical protein
MDASTVPQLFPNAVYDDLALHLLLGVSMQVLADARRQGELRYARKGARTLYLGRWVLRWLARDGKAAQP